MDHKQVTVRSFFQETENSRNCSSQGYNFPSIQLLMLHNISPLQVYGTAAVKPIMTVKWRYQWLIVPQSKSVYSQFFSLWNVFWTFPANRTVANGFLCLVLKYKNLFLFSSFLTKPTLVYDFPYCRITGFFLFRGKSEIEMVYWRWYTCVTSCFLQFILSLEMMGNQYFPRDFYCQSVYPPEPLRYPS